MDNASSSGILRGKPFGGICFLWRKFIAKCIKVVNCYPNGRCVALSLRVANEIILIVSVYITNFNCSATYKVELGECIGFIENTINSNIYHDLIIVSDTHFPCSLSNPWFKQFNQFLTDFKLVHCDNFISNPDINTYVHDALGNFSCIDHFFVTNALLLNLKKISITDSGVNHSDHKPICGFFDISLDLNIAKSGKTSLRAGYNSYS